MKLHERTSAVYERFQDPVLELAARLNGDPAVGVLELAADMTDEEAEVALAVLDEADAAERASELARDLRRAGQLW